MLYPPGLSLGYWACFSKLITRSWREHDAYDGTHRLDANMDMYHGQGAVSTTSSVSFPKAGNPEAAEFNGARTSDYGIENGRWHTSGELLICLRILLYFRFPA